jgi:hypothetical protein
MQPEHSAELTGAVAYMQPNIPNFSTNDGDYADDGHELCCTLPAVILIKHSRGQDMVLSDARSLLTTSHLSLSYVHAWWQQVYICARSSFVTCAVV